MSNKMITVLGALVVGLGALAATTPGCGGSSGSVADTCSKICDKEGACKPQFAAFVSQCKASCANPGGTSGTNPATSCPGLSTDQAIAKANACLSGTCDDLDTCIGNICPDSTGSAGTTGHAGTSGSAGTAGSAGATGSAGTTGSAGATGSAGGSCTTTCTKAQACCVALAQQFGSDAGSCSFDNTQICSGANASQSAQGCQSVLTSGASLNLAACK